MNRSNKVLLEVTGRGSIPDSILIRSARIRSLLSSSSRKPSSRSEPSLRALRRHSQQLRFDPDIRVEVSIDEHFCRAAPREATSVHPA